MTEYEKERDYNAKETSEWCYCAGYTCSGCEEKTINLFTTAANWSRDYFKKELIGTLDQLMKNKLINQHVYNELKDLG